MKKIENRENIFSNDNDDVVTSSNDDVDCVEFVVKQKQNEKFKR